jgi:hypothetical protein
VSDDKKMLPEVLPAPGGPVSASPQQRVHERARLLLDRFRGLGPMAGAAILSMQCYSSVDPLPPPAQECANVPDPFDRIYGMGSFDYGHDGGPPFAVISLVRYNEIGLGVAAVRITGGTLISVEDLTRPGNGGFSEFRLTIAPEGVTSSFTIELDFTCGDATATKRFQASYATPLMYGDNITVQAL